MKANDRVLLLAMPEPSELLMLAGKLADGLVVVLVDQEQVYEARRLARNFDNVMFTVRDGEAIPWRDDFFTLVYEPAMGERQT